MEPAAEGVLITGVFGAGKSAVAAEIAYLLETRGQPFAYLDLDYLGWGGPSDDSHGASFGLMLKNLAAVVANYRDAGVALFILAYFLPGAAARARVTAAAGMPLRVARLEVPLPDIERRLAADPTSGRRDDLRQAARSLAAGEGAGVADAVFDGRRPVGDVARDIMAWLGWLP